MTTTPESATTEVGLWVAQFSAGSQDLKDAAGAATQAAWLSFDGWYDEVLVAALAAEMANASTAAQQTAAGMAAEYTSQVIGAVTGATVPPIGRINLTPVRNGRDANLVHSRPAEAYKRAIATGSTHEEALVKVGLRASGLAVTDITLQERAWQHEILTKAGITQYRRIIRPELSKTGTCGLCIVAADRIYKTGDLMPIHPPSCKCVTAPIVGDADPGGQLNREDLDALYAAAGSNKANDLRRTRYQVNEHGEFGPVLTFAKDNFRGPDKVGLENDPERAGRMLAKALPVLADLEDRAAAGDDVTDPLTYQRGLVARLRRIVGS